MEQVPSLGPRPFLDLFGRLFTTVWALLPLSTSMSATALPPPQLSGVAPAVDLIAPTPPPPIAATHPFLSHLVALLSVYELQPAQNSKSGTPALPLPRYEGPQDWQTESIERSLAVIANRMRAAEEKLGAVHPWTSRREHDDHDPSSRRDADDEDDGEGSTPTAKQAGLQNQSPFHAQHHNATVSALKEYKSGRAPSPMQISMPPARDPNTFHPLRSPSVLGTPSSSSTGHPSPYHCPTCRRPVGPGYKSSSTTNGTSTQGGGSFQPSPDGSPLVVPPGPLSAAAFESGMSAVEELRLLKAQVQDVARVCKAVADGDLTQKITVPVQGPVMVQLKDVINTMVDKLGQFAREVTRVSLEVGTEGYVSPFGFMRAPRNDGLSYIVQKTWRPSASRRCPRNMARTYQCRQPSRCKSIHPGPVYRYRHNRRRSRRLESNDRNQCKGRNGRTQEYGQ